MEKEYYSITELEQLGIPRLISNQYAHSKNANVLQKKSRCKYAIHKQSLIDWLKKQNKKNS